MVSRLLDHCRLVSTLAHLRAISVIDQSNIRSSTRDPTVDAAVLCPSLHRIPLFDHLLLRCHSSSENPHRLILVGDGAVFQVYFIGLKNGRKKPWIIAYFIVTTISMIDLILSASFGCQAKVNIPLKHEGSMHRFSHLDDQYSLPSSTVLHGGDLSRDEEDLQ